MTVAAAQISDIVNTNVQSNVRTYGCSELKHRTDQDENKVGWDGLVVLPANMYKDGIACHSVCIRLYSNLSCTIIVSHLPIARKFQKVMST